MPYFPGGYFPSGRVVTASGGGSGGSLEDAILALQTALEATLKAAWTIQPGNIHEDPMPTDPENLPAGVTSALPAAWVGLGNVTPSYEASNARAARDASHFVAWRLSGLFDTPTTGTIQTAKIARMREVRTLLTAATDRKYGGWHYTVGEMDYETLPDENNGVYSISIGFITEIITDA